MDEAQKQAMAEAVARIRENMTTAAKAAGRDPGEVLLCAACKTRTVEEVRYSADLPIDLFGENHVQELVEKTDAGAYNGKPGHFIGHLQTNKVKYMAPYVAMIHAIDSYKLLVEVNKQASKVHRVIPCLLQIHIAQEETKFGFSFDECREMLDTGGWKDLKNVRLSGVMGMATNVDDDEQIKREFCSLNTFFKEIKQNYFSDSEYFKEISMGMSHDYPLAVEAGSTLVRVGSKIFGERNY